MNPLLHWGNKGIIRGFHSLDPLGGLGRQCSILVRTQAQTVCRLAPVLDGNPRNPEKSELLTKECVFKSWELPCDSLHDSWLKGFECPERQEDSREIP